MKSSRAFTPSGAILVTMMEDVYKPAEEESGFIRQALKIAAYPIAILSGYWVTRSHIRHCVYDNLKQQGGLQDILPEHEKKLSRIVDEGVAKIRRGETVELLHESQAIQSEYTSVVRKRFEDLGIRGIGKEWNFILKRERHDALLNGLTAAGISIGALLTIAHSKALTRVFFGDKKDRKSAEDKYTVV